MSNLTDRVSFLKGLAEGMKLNEETNEGKLLARMLEVLGEMAEEISSLREDHEELAEYVENIDEDLTDMEETLFGDDDECACCHGDGEDDEEGETIQYACPHCGHEMTFDTAEFDFDEEYLCPECKKPIFPEQMDEDDED